jgi:hypothetical protein
MVILCDTCSILMLLRIAPDMFIDPRYECRTIREIHDELIQTTRFKTKYPWVGNYRTKIKPGILTEAEKKAEADLYLAIKALNDEPVINVRNGRPFDLSFRDMKVASHSLALGCAISSGDTNLVEFILQEFPDDSEGNLTSLEVLNGWLGNGLFAWNAGHQSLLEQWSILGERKQPVRATKLFEKLTHFKYPGP